MDGHSHVTLPCSIENITRPYLKTKRKIILEFPVLFHGH